MEPFLIKQNDRLPALEATLSDAGGALPSIAEARVFFAMKRARTGETVVRGEGTVADAGAKRVRYDWAPGDTAEAGAFCAEFELSFGGRTWTFPQTGYIAVHIAPDCG